MTKRYISFHCYEGIRAEAVESDDVNWVTLYDRETDDELATFFFSSYAYCRQLAGAINSIKMR